MAAVLAAAALAGCTGGSDRPARSGTSGNGSSPATASSTPIGVAPSRPTNNAVNELAATPRSKLRSSGTLTWALSQPIGNFDPYTPIGATADASSVLNALLPRPYHFDAAGVPAVDTDYFTSIAVTSRQPLTVSYRFNPKARWSNGRSLGWQAARTDRGVQIRQAAGENERQLLLNTADPTLIDPRVRQAVVLGIDRQARR